MEGKIKTLNQDEYLELLYEAYRNYDAVKYANDQAIFDELTKSIGGQPPKFPTQPDGSFYAAPNWDNELFNKVATTVSNEISMSGGNDKSNFYLNLEYTKQNGVVKETGYDRKSLRFNFENRPAKWLKIGLNSTLSYNIQDYGGPLRGSDGPVNSILSPLNPVRLYDGSYALNYLWGGAFSPQANPVAAAEYNISRNTGYRGLSKMFGELSFMKWFKIISNLGIDYMQTEAKEKADPRLYDPGNAVTPGTSTAGRVEEQDVRRTNLISTNMLRFDRTWKSSHAVNILVGQEAQILSQKNLLLAVRGLSSPYYDQINSPGVTVLRQSGFVTKETLLSFFGQANYGFNNRYFFTASIRRDGSSRFGDERRYGTYWSTGAGWVVTSESFMNGTHNWLDYLKIRGSIGAAGNAAGIDRFTRFDRLQSTTFLGSIAIYPNVSAGPANQDVQWESTFTWDAGLEARFLKERIAITADIYQRNTSDLIYQINLPQNSGYNTVLANIGKMENKGIELSLSANIIQNRFFRWNLNANWSTNKNILTKAYVPTATVSTNLLYNQEGENFNSYYLVKWAGVNPDDGSPQWIDSAGKPTSVYNSGKKEFVGKPQPDGFGGVTNTFSYKNVELSAFFYYQYGYQIYNENVLLNDGRFPYLNQDKSALNRWQKQGDIAANPKRVLNNNSGSTNPSTRFLYDGDYIRLQNVTLSYSFNKRTLDLLRLSMLKVYVQGNNLAIWTKFPGKDPSTVNTVGQTGYIYPNLRSFSLGLNLNF